MCRTKIWTLVSMIISLIMCVVLLNVNFLHSRYIISYNTEVSLLSELSINNFNFEKKAILSIILASIFLINTISLTLYIFNIDIRTKKYLSFICILLLISGLLLFILYVISFIAFHDLYSNYEYFPLRFKIYRWIPRFLIFLIPTLYLFGTQIYLINKLKFPKLNKNIIILNIYLICVVFLTNITYFRSSIFLDQLISYSGLITCAEILGDQIFGETSVNTEYFAFYFLLFTVIAAIYFILSKCRKIKKNT